MIRRGRVASTVTITSAWGATYTGNFAPTEADPSWAASASYAPKKLLGSAIVRGETLCVTDTRCPACRTSLVADAG